MAILRGGLREGRMVDAICYPAQTKKHRGYSALKLGVMLKLG